MIFLVSQHANSQEYTYAHFGEEDGLPGSEIYHTIQDTKGYIWFATDNGVSRFDGENFENFDINSGLVNNTVFDLYEDYKGRIWFISLSGQLCYFENDKITHYPFNSVIENKLGVRAIPVKNSFCVDSLDNICFSVGHYGIFNINATGELNKQQNDYNVSTIIISKRSKNSYSMGFRDRGSAKIALAMNEHFMAFDYKINPTRSSLFFANEGDSENEIIFSANKYIFKYNANNITKLIDCQDDIIWFSKDRNKNYWVSIRNKGIKCFTNTNFNDPPDVWFLKDKEVSSVLVDNENGIWFTTLNNGVYYLPSREIKTLPFPSLRSDNVLAVAATPHYLCLSTEEDALIAFEKKSMTHAFTLKLPDNNTSLKLIYHPVDQSLICGTYDLCRFFDENTKNSHAIKSARIKYSGRMDRAIKSLIAGKGEYFWAGTYTGLYKFNKDSITYLSNASDEWEKTVYAIFENEDKSLWLGTLNGLWKYRNGEYEYFGKNNTVLSHRINALYKNSNSLFIGTKGFGLIILDLNDFSTKIINTSNGLASNSISSIVEYKNELWIGTNKGINKIAFNKQKEISISRLDVSSGLINNEINQLLMDDSILYIATRHGINYLNIDRIEWAEAKPKLHIQTIKINNKDTLILPGYHLNYKQNNISFSYIGISYKSRKNILYKYQLYPLEQKWEETNFNNINYFNLAPGNYQFRIKALNSSGTWSDVNETISFSIASPFWQKWWFYLIVLSFIVIFIFLSIQKILFKIRNENRLRMELKTFMSKTVATQINPHFIFNSFNSIHHSILKNDKLESSKNLSKLSSYIRAVLDAVQKEFLTLSDELFIVKLYLELEKFRLKDKLAYELIIDKNIDQKNLIIPGLFIQPLVEKAIWNRLKTNNEGNFVKITIDKHQNSIIVLIEDNGKIDDSNNLNQGINTDFINKRIQLLNELYKGQITFGFTQNTLVSFNQKGNIVKLVLELSQGRNYRFWKKQKQLKEQK